MTPEQPDIPDELAEARAKFLEEFRSLVARRFRRRKKRGIGYTRRPATRRKRKGGKLVANRMRDQVLNPNNWRTP